MRCCGELGAGAAERWVGWLLVQFEMQMSSKCGR